MKRTLLILGGIGLVCALLIFRLFWKEHSRLQGEREWFAESLRYEFSARVDSIRMLNKHTGRLWCRITSGNPQQYREDSLKRHFEEHDMLYFIIEQSADTVTFLIPYANLVAVGDSVRVSSGENVVRFFRNGKKIATESLSETLTGFGRPFYLKD